ncbi:MAG TPA: hypothetical protein VFR41_10545 [Acidimicrobiia bacterium]|nr:hypothetical protein [Acidimicrobiia bacterium]
MISFWFTSKRDAQAQRLRLQRWVEERTHLAYVRGAGTGVLVDVESLFARMG